VGRWVHKFLSSSKSIILHEILYNLFSNNVLACKLQCQNIVVDYGTKLQIPDSLVKNNSDVKNLLYLMSKRVKDFKGKLIVSEQKTKFETSTNMPLGDDSSADMAITYTLNSKDVYFTSKDSVVHITEMLISPFAVKYKANYSWQLLKGGGKEIKGFNCLKAICTHRDIKGNEIKVEAYYAPSLPYSFGPVGYMGLPGLILELNVNNLIYTAVDISETNKTKNFQIPNKEVLSLEEFRKILKKTEKNFSNEKG
jgi:GLPGLI family protein